MAIEPIKVWELVDRAVSHKWSVPEFQRAFVWKPTQVRDLAESLWLDFPVGSLLVWDSKNPEEPHGAKDGVSPSLWIVDGQQRTTALAILFGRKPYWWESAHDWNTTLRRYDIRFDSAATEAPFFLVANAAIRNAKGSRYIPLQTLLSWDTNRESDQQQLQTLAEDIKQQGLCDGMNVMTVYTRLDRVRKIRDNDIVAITIHHELEDVVEIFSRLNSRGTRVTEADIYLGIVASKNQGWVRDKFLPFLSDLSDSGFHIDPNLLFRSLTAVGAGKVRFRDISDDFWSPSVIEPAWDRCQRAWKRMIDRLQVHGVLTDDILPTKAALVTLVALLDRFPDAPDFSPAFYWFVQASRFGRYSGSGTTSLDEDLRDIASASALPRAVSLLLKRFHSSRPMEPEDFERDYSDGRFGRFLLYLLAYRNCAQDWDESGARLGFAGAQILADFRPQWHHIFPVKFLQGKVDDARINMLANIAVIGPSINIRISAQDPMHYLDKYHITDEKLGQQFIEWPRTRFSVDLFSEFIEDRAGRLAAGANEFLADLRRGMASDLGPAIY